MKIDFSRTLEDLDGAPITDSDGKTPATLGRVSATALLGTFENENPDGPEKVKRFVLAKKIVKGGNQDIMPEDAALIRSLIAKAYATIIVGQAFEMLE